MNIGGDHGRVRTLAWGLVALVVVAGVGAMLASGEAAATVAGAARAASEAHWAVVPVVSALVVVHFWFSAVALRGAAGRPLPLLHATMAQFTGATANRITGGGLGTVAVNARYLTAQGVPAGRSVAVAGVLQVAGAVADLLLFGVVVAVAVAAGDGVLLRHMPAVGGETLAVGAAVAAAVCAVAGLAGWLLRDRLRGAVADGFRVCAQMLRRPGDMLVMLLASAATTLVMGVAFAVSMLAVPGAVSPGQIGTLLTIFMIGAAAGGVVPGPGGLGSTEAALVALLAVVGVGAAEALSGVLIFRALTHWAPVPIGLLAAGTVRRRKPAQVVALPALEQQETSAVAHAA